MPQLSEGYPCICIFTLLVTRYYWYRSSPLKLGVPRTPHRRTAHAALRRGRGGGSLGAHPPGQTHAAMGPPWLPLRQHRTGRTLVADDGERLRLAQRVLLALALLAGALVLWRDHGHRRRRRGGGGESSSRTPEATVPADATSSSGPDDDRMPRRLMDGLAALAVASALLGTFSK